MFIIYYIKVHFNNLNWEWYFDLNHANFDLLWFINLHVCTSKPFSILALCPNMHGSLGATNVIHVWTSVKCRKIKYLFSCCEAYPHYHTHKHIFCLSHQHLQSQVFSSFSSGFRISSAAALSNFLVCMCNHLNCFKL